MKVNMVTVAVTRRKGSLELHLGERISCTEEDDTGKIKVSAFLRLKKEVDRLLKAGSSELLNVAPSTGEQTIEKDRAREFMQELNRRLMEKKSEEGLLEVEESPHPTR